MKCRPGTLELEAGAEDRCPAATREQRQEVGIEDTEFRDIDLVPCAEQYVVEHRRAVTKHQRDPLASDHRAVNAFAREHTHAGKAQTQPRRCAGAQAARAELHPHLRGHRMGEVRPLGEPVQGKRPDPGRRGEPLTQPIDRGAPALGAAAEPMHVAAADELDVGARLMQQHRGFAGALAASDHRNTTAAEDAEIAVLAGVARKLRGDIGKGVRPKRLAGKPGRDNDPARMDVRAIHSLDAETVAGGFRAARSSACRRRGRRRAGTRFRNRQKFRAGAAPTARGRARRRTHRGRGLRADRGCALRPTASAASCPAACCAARTTSARRTAASQRRVRQDEPQPPGRRARRR